ncbi:fibronectin type III domain-containing protein [Chitinophaga horti]|uniref:Fibronectin type III domain-containing protein n=1 Tax=Chitinophaga horti TaxID=2920382 RepID=A0ABY6J4D6_9BACT|nr:fibronectin type III domain-containing protein [Chitinophaga horti]UYQ94533.1 fibronectin type III domain-containing protein [Chitinophaga horti]
MHQLLQRLCLCAGALCLAAPAFSQTDITEDGGVITSPHINWNSNENFPKLIDNYPGTKYQYESGAFTVVYEANFPSLVTQYAVTSAADNPDRDPMNWVLDGSNDGVNWTSLDQRFGQFFNARLERQLFTIATPGTYKQYRLIAFATREGRYIHLGEWELLSPVKTAIPASLTATLVPGQRVKIGWKDNATNETGYSVERSTDGRNYHIAALLPPNAKSYIDSNLATDQQYAYRVRAITTEGAGKASPAAIIRTEKGPSLDDITDFKEGRLTARYAYSGPEGLSKLTDNTPNSFLHMWNSPSWLLYYLPGGAVVTQYAFTVSNESAEYDPSDWTLEASNDSLNWTVLNTQHKQQFERGTRRVYAFANKSNYQYYRFQLANNSWGINLSELEILGKGEGSLSKDKPVTAGNFHAQGVSPYQVVLAWNDDANDETSYRLERSKDSIRWNTVDNLNPGTTLFYSRNLTPQTKYYYRLSAINRNGRSAYTYVSATTTPDESPLYWQEHWLEHRQLLKRVHNNKDVAFYFDNDVPANTTWMFTEFTAAWKYIKKTYGTFCDPKLYVVLHEDKYHGGHAAAVCDSNHDYRNVIDLGGEWSFRNDWNIGAPVHEIGHIVEGNSKDVRESPAFSIWGDSKWCEIFNYDVYKNIGWAEDAKAVYDQMQTHSDVFPRPGTYWFRDWFYPLYTRGDSSVTLNRYFELLADYFPQHNGVYTRRMNMGEFVHFWSGAAGYNLKAQADTAFGWNDEYEMQFKQARIDYPFTYPENCRPRPLPSKPWNQAHEYLTALWPNPASGTLYFNGPNDRTVYTVEAYALSGQRSLTARVSGKNAPIDVSALHTGLYLFAVSDQSGVLFTRKILITKPSGKGKYQG